MTVTASRLGSAPLTLDWSNLISAPPKGHPVDPEDAKAAWDKFRARATQGEVGFYEAPFKNELSQAVESQALAEQLLSKGLFTDLVILGIGGSALGPISLLTSLQERCRPTLRFHFLENPDPVEWRTLIKRLNPQSTLVCVVTKSGTTFETIAQFLLALEWLGRDRIKTHIVAITDPAKGDLKTFATDNGIPTLHIAPSIGGRFSVFSPVGLFPAAIAGLSIPEFLKGAKQVHDYMEKAPAEKNPIFILGHEFIRQYSKRSVHVCMPYSTRLKTIGAWFVQLWGESLGKNGKGFTPLAAVGATDQHSILQLLRDGPDDKVTFFLTVGKVEDPITVPRVLSLSPKGMYPAFKLLEGHTLHDLLIIEYQATSLVLTKQGRPNLTIQIDQLDERSLGALYYAFSCLTAFTGTLWEVNPFDQPGVEEGKVYIREALNRAPSSPSPEDDDNSPVGRLRRNS